MPTNRNIDPAVEDIGAETIPGARPVSPRPGRKRPAGASAPRTAADTSAPRRGERPASRAKAKSEPSYNFISFLRDYRSHLGVGILLCLTSFATVVCAISFMFSHGADQSVTHGRSVQEIVEAGDVVENAGGPVGSKLAELLLVDTFGIGSFILAVYVFLLGLAVMKVKKCSFWSLSFRCLFSTAALSVIVGILTYNSSGAFNLGGAHGLHMSELLLQYTGALGAYCSLVALIGLLVAVFLKPLGSLWRVMSKAMSRPRREPQGAEAEDEAAEERPMDILEPDAVADGAETPESDEDLETVAAAPGIASAGADIPESHLRFMPHDDAAEAEETVAETPADDVADTPATAGAVIASNPGEPEMIIKNAVVADEAADEDRPAIVDGDHIGLDVPYDQCAGHSNYVFPPLDLLIDRPNPLVINEQEQAENKNMIVNALRSYDVEIQRIEATIGPTVTLYEIVPAEGTRIAKIKSLEDDIAMSLAALGIRIIAPIPGKGTIGIEVPNKTPQIVSMRTVLESSTFARAREKMHLPLILGATVSNEFYTADLTKMPHLLVAGATGQGKSVGLNCIITSLLYSKHPDEVKFVLIDPKMVEFSLYETIANQYMAKLPDEPRSVITDPQKVVATLNSLCVEMDRRYELLTDAGVRGVEAYNERFVQRRLNPEKGHRYLPYIVVIVDEFADLIQTAGKDISHPIARIAQKARAVGIHMIIATQRPSTDVITGMIKANFPARIAFKTTQSIDSKTILDRPGAQRLIGRGDMLALIDGRIERVQCAFVDTEEVEAICEHIGSQPGFTMPLALPEVPEDGGADGPVEIGATTDEFRRCALFIASQTQASITMLQRKFEIGFNKAGRFMDQMQTLGIVGPANGAKPRQVLMTPDEVQRLFD